MFKSGLSSNRLMLRKARAVSIHLSKLSTTPIHEAPSVMVLLKGLLLLAHH